MKDEQVNVWSPSERFHGPSEVVSATLCRGWEVRENGGSDGGLGLGVLWSLGW